MLALAVEGIVGDTDIVHIVEDRVVGTVAEVVGIVVDTVAEVVGIVVVDKAVVHTAVGEEVLFVSLLSVLTISWLLEWRSVSLLRKLLLVLRIARCHCK